MFLKEIGQNWSDILQLYQQNADLSIKSSLNNMNSILDSDALFKMFNQHKLGFKTTLDNSCSSKINLFQKLITQQINKFIKDPRAKEHYHINYDLQKYVISPHEKK